VDVISVHDRVLVVAGRAEHPHAPVSDDGTAPVAGGW
jgi:hypothetical protein